MSRNRDDFTKATVEKIAKRVGFHCSNPNCRAITVGPKQSNDGFAVLGQAAHISAAAPGGPRFDSSMTSEQRKSPGNGIWLCEKCARIIDIDADAYPVELLREWKKDAEELQTEAVLKSLTEDVIIPQPGEQTPLRYLQQFEHSDLLFGIRATGESLHNTYLQSKLYRPFDSGDSSSHVPFKIWDGMVRAKPILETHGYLYVKGLVCPIGAANVEIYTEGPFTHYEIIAEYYRFAVIIVGEKYFGYRFECCVEEPSVLMRKKAFLDVMEIVKHDDLYLKLPDGHLIDIEMCINIEGSRWHEAYERLGSYLDCMNRLLDIEDYYNIIFSLPPKLTHEEINSLLTISASINREKCITLPGLPRVEYDSEDFSVEEVEIPFDTPITENISMFGFVFSPTKYYIPASTFSYDKKKKLFCNCSEGLGIGCDFSYTET